MKTKQTIAIIGASGKTGSALAFSFASANYRLLLDEESTNGPEQLKTILMAQLPQAEIETAECASEACWEADIIIPAVPYPEQQKVAEKIREVANQKIVLSVMNPIDEVTGSLLTASDSSAAEELQQMLPYSKVVTAFNTLFAEEFYRTARAEIPDVFIAGNNPEAIYQVAELVQDAGFNALIAGDLSLSRTLEQMHLLLLQVNNRYQHKTGWKLMNNNSNPPVPYINQPVFLHRLNR